MTSADSRAPADDEFAALVHVAWPALHRTALLLTGDPRLAEDLAQHALATTYSKWHRLRDPLAARAYARRVLVNSTTSWFRRPTHRNERPTDAVPERATADDVGSMAGDRVDVQSALRQLAPRQRAVVVLRFFDDLSVAETAEVLGIAPGTVKSQTSDALARLRDLLGTDLVEHADPSSGPRNRGGSHA